MGKKSTPTAPTPPDPTVVANAQSDANIASATAQQKLNMINTTGPNGTVNYQADPNAPGGYNQVTTLSPEQQGLYNSSTSAQQGALNVANQQIGRVGDALGQQLNPDGVQQSFGQGGALQSGYDPGGTIQNNFNPGQAVQGHVGSQQNSQQAIQDASDAVYNQAKSRLDPQWQLAQQQEDTKLANQGLGANSTAYQNAQNMFGQQKNDAYTSAQNAAITSGQNEQNTLYGQQLQSGQFANQAANQQYTQNAGQAAFNNSAQSQQNSQNAAAAAFNNTTAAQQFAQNQSAATFGNQANAQQFQQNAYAQQLPINEFNSLMSSGQVQMPTGINYTPSSVNPTDVTGAYALNSQAAQAAYQSQLQNQSSALGGLFNLGAAGLKAYAGVPGT